MREREVKIVGHRGAMAAWPENTIAGIEAALEQGADGVEIDIWCHESGRLLVFHDPTLERTTGAHGSIESTPFDTLRALDAGRGEQIPLLEEVLALTNARCELNIELKGPNTGFGLARFLDQNTWVDRDALLLSSFKLEELAVVQRELSEVRRGVLVSKPEDGVWGEIERLGAYSLHPHFRHTNSDTIARARDAGVEVYVWTVNDPEDGQRLAALGVSALITDVPGQMCRSLSGQ